MQMTLSSNIKLHSDRLNGIRYLGRVVDIDNGAIVIKSGFTWDGATFWPDGKRGDDGRPVTWLATCVHDALFYEKAKYGLEVSNKVIDKIMYDELKKIDYKWARVWYWGVRVFGRFFR